MYRFRRWRKDEMAEANAAAVRIQRQFRVHHGQRWLERRRGSADAVLEFLRVCLVRMCAVCLSVLSCDCRFASLAHSLRISASCLIPFAPV